VTYQVTYPALFAISLRTLARDAQAADALMPFLDAFVELLSPETRDHKEAPSGFALGEESLCLAVVSHIPKSPSLSPSVPPSLRPSVPPSLRPSVPPKHDMYNDLETATTNKVSVHWGASG